MPAEVVYILQIKSTIQSRVTLFILYKQTKAKKKIFIKCCDGSLSEMV